MVYSEKLTNVEKILFPHINRSTTENKKEWKYISYGCSPDLYAFLKNLKDNKCIPTMSDLIDDALNFYFAIGPLLIKNSTNFVLHEQKDWSNEDYDFFLDQLFSMNELFSKIIHKNLQLERKGKEKK